MGLRAELGASGDDEHDSEGDSEETRKNLMLDGKRNLERYNKDKKEGGKGAWQPFVRHIPATRDLATGKGATEMGTAPVLRSCTCLLDLKHDEV